MNTFTSECPYILHGHSTVQCTTQMFSLTNVSARLPWECHPSMMQICKQSLVRGVKFGPFSSTPGSWHKILSTPISPLLLEAGDRIKGYVGHAVDASGYEIGFPPLHMHHIHVHKRTRRQVAFHNFDEHTNIHFFETHGDFLSKNPKNPSAYYKWVPEGYCNVVEDDPDLNIVTYFQIDDQRAHFKRLQPITFYVEVAFLLTQMPCKLASSIWLHNAQNPLLNRPTPFYVKDHSAPSIQDFYDVLNVPSVSWWSSKMPISGKLLPGTWSHVHRLRDAGAMLFAAPISDLPLCSNPIVDVRLGEYAMLSLNGMDTLRSQLVSSTHLVCSDSPSMRAVKVSDLELGIRNGSKFDRNGDVKCKDWNFRRGDPWTVVSLHAPMWDESSTHTPMHTVFFMWIEPVNDSSTDWVVFGETFNACRHKLKALQWHVEYGYLPLLIGVTLTLSSSKSRYALIF